MKIFLRLSAFVLSLTLGVQLVAFASWAVTNFTIPMYVSEETIAELDAITAKPPIGLYVTYAGMVPANREAGPYLRFIAYNGTSDTINYSGFGSHMPFPHIAANGRDVSSWVCRNGSTEHSIEPDNTAEFRVPVYEFALVPNRRDDVTVGFYLRPDHSDETEVTNSQPFVLPDEFRIAIRKYQHAMNSSQ